MFTAWMPGLIREMEPISHMESMLRSGRKIPRRAALEGLGSGALLALGLWPGALKAAGANNSGAFRFLVVNDTHYMSPECGAWLQAVVRQMKSHQGIELCLHAGDLTEHGQREDLAVVRDIFRGLAVPTYGVIGNHDYLTQTDRRPYESIFRRWLNYVFMHRGWQFVGLDTTDGLRFEKTEIPDATFLWLDDHLRKLSQKSPTVILTHFPLGAGVSYRPLNADALLERFKPFNLQAVFSGHFHGFTERKTGRTTLTTNRCCALKRANHDQTTEKGYFLCEARDGMISRSFVEFRTVHE